MMRSKFEVADIIRGWGDEFFAKCHVVGQVRKTFAAMAMCRTRNLGGHVEACPECGEVRVSYNSCHDRHCPKCQQKDREQWIEARKEEVMPVKYFHVVFTIPTCLHELAMHNQREFYGCMFRAAWKTVALFAAKQGLQAGMSSILHTWGSNLSYHPHIHCIIPGGGVDEEGVWHNFNGCEKNGNFLFPVQALSLVFRAKFMAMLTRNLKERGILIQQNVRKKAFNTEWVVNSRPPAKGVNQVLEYIGRYAYRVAISNSRIKDISARGIVTYDYKDYKQEGVHKLMSMHAVDFLRLFSLHVLPVSFVRIRHYGILSPSNRDKVRKVQEQLGAPVIPKQRKKKSYLQICQERGWNIGKCPCCGVSMLIIEVIRPRSPPASISSATNSKQ